MGEIKRDRGESEFQRHWWILVRRRWVIYLSVLALGLISLIGSFLTTPLYKATTTLQIERHQPDILNIREISRPEYMSDHYYQTQYEIIRSAPVARLAVERLDLTSHKAFAAPRTASLFSRLAALLPRKSRPRIERDPVDIVADRLRTRLEVLPITYSYLVDIAWAHQDPRFAAEVTNAVADAYIHFSLKSNFSMTDGAREFLVTQIETLKKEIEAIEERLQEYAEAKNIFSIDESNNLTLGALEDISEQRTVAETALARAEAAHSAVAGAAAESLPEVMESELIGRLRAEYASHEAQYSEKSRVFGNDWPGMQTLTSKLEQSRRRLELETTHIAEQVRAASAAEFARARSEVSHLDRLLKQHEQAAQRLKRDAVEYANLHSEVLKKRESLGALLSRQNEMALSTRLQELESTSSNIRIVERAQPPAVPYRPRTTLNLMVGLMLGLTLGFALAFTLDYVDNTITSPEELESLLSVPVLAVIPRHGTQDATRVRVRRKPAVAAESFDLITHEDGRAWASEAYRGLRTSILLSNPGRPPRRIVITSAVPQEGKTATTLNLGIVLAQLGRRVVLVDTDLRRPRLHLALRVSERVGTSTFLSGLEKDSSRLVVPTNVEHLFFIPSGPIPPNPSELLNSPVFARLGNELLEQGFDHILFDSPPVLSVSDPVIVSTVADTCIVVVRAGSTPRQSVLVAVERLKQAVGGPLGVVLNRFDAERQGSGYDRYEYDERYRPAPDHVEVEAAGDSARRAAGA